MNRLIRYFLPPDAWRTPVILLLGVFCGLLCFTLYIAKATSYLSEKPETCVNCHIMSPHYATWFHSSHREKATCNDCHVPHDNVVNQYYFKAKDGIRHATMFMFRMEPQVIRIAEGSKKVVQDNCIRCHNNLITDPQMEGKNNVNPCRKDRTCWECHREVPHGRVNSLSSVTKQVPLSTSPVPQWLKKRVNQSK